MVVDHLGEIRYSESLRSLINSGERGVLWGRERRGICIISVKLLGIGCKPQGTLRG